MDFSKWVTQVATLKSQIEKTIPSLRSLSELVFLQTSVYPFVSSCDVSWMRFDMICCLGNQTHKLYYLETIVCKLLMSPECRMMALKQWNKKQVKASIIL